MKINLISGAVIVLVLIVTGLFVFQPQPQSDLLSEDPNFNEEGIEENNTEKVTPTLGEVGAPTHRGVGVEGEDSSKMVEKIANEPEPRLSDKHEVKLPVRDNYKEPIKKTFRLEIPTDAERATLPSCEGAKFTTFPVDMNKVPDIAPLGNLGPPGHTFPTDHSYISVGEDVGGAYGSGKAYDLFSPADVYLTSISWSKNTQDPRDYTLYFAMCKDVIGYYNHVKTVSPKMQALIDKYDCEAFSKQDPNSCTKVLDLDLFKEGELMGTVGLKQGNWDFGLIDLRVNLPFVNPKRYPERSLHIQCAYDYYPAAMKKTFYDLIPRIDGTCGRTMQDVAGTLMGNWFHENAQEEKVVDWRMYLAFVEDNYFPDIKVVSVAGIFTNPAKYEFYPKDSGRINRKFSEVTSDGNIYCYQSEEVEKFQSSRPTGKVVVQMTDKETLKIEHQSGTCDGGEVLFNPEIYRR